VFRQVVAIRWAEAVTPEAKQEYRDALDALRGVPQLLALTWGDDAGHFDGNFDFVAVMDFADFASARVYVEHPLHQAYLRDHASKVVGERVIVQHEWTPPASL
jgi:Stress responsive A/B Barrel Domain